MIDGRGYLSTGDAARRLGISRYTLLRAVHQQKIAPAFHTPGGRLRFSELAIDDYARLLGTPDHQDSRNGEVKEPSRLNQALHTAEEYFRSAFDSIAVGMAILSPEGRYLRVNQGLCLLLGYSEAELLTRDWQSITYAEDCERSFEPIREILAGGTASYVIEKRYVRKNGALIWVLLSTTLVRDASGAAQHWVSQVQDITARREAEESCRASEERLRTVVENAPIIIYALDLDGTFSLSEGLGLETLGLLPGAVVGSSIFDIYHDKPEILAAFHRALQGETVSFTARVGAGVFDIRQTPLCDGTGQVTGVIGVATDISEQTRAAEAQRRSEDRFRALVEGAPIGVCIVDENKTLQVWNPAHARLLGYCDKSSGSAQDEDPPTLQEAHEIRDFRQWLQTSEQIDFERALPAVDGQQRVVRTTGVPIDGPDGRRMGAFFAIDVTAERKFEEHLTHLAHHDALTALPNRILFSDRLVQALRLAQRQGLSVTLLLIDLDRFKEVNDTLGHEAGDRLLCQVAQRLQKVLRGSDTVARLGGDEFAVLLPATDDRGAVTACQKLLSALAEPFALDGHHLAVGASIGIAMYPYHGSDESLLLRRADVAMYAAKRGGGGYAVYSRDLDSYSPLRLSLSGELRQAIAAQQFVVHYQPIVHLANGRPCGMEALVRWQHPDYGFLPPSQFIPLAEENGQIVELTRYVLAEALRQCRIWEEEGVAVGISVNLSARALHDEQLPLTVAELLTSLRVPPQRLTLEVTESTVMSEPERSITILTRLSDLGVRIAVDDFGTGHSSLSYLQRLPIHELKIDRSFIASILTDRNAASIVAFILGLGRALHLWCVVEGVEDDATLGLLAALGGDAAQGFGISRPLAADAIKQWLKGAFATEN